MKRWISSLLILSLLAALALPAMAAAQEGADARLVRVTQAVKNTLGLDTEQYTDFRGDVMEQELGVVWSLYWSGDGTSLNVEALEDGTVLSYWRNDNSDSYSYSQRLSVFPKVDPQKARAAAQDFLTRVLDPATESVELEDPSNRLGSVNCQFYGYILLNGLPSPLSYSVTVRGSDNQVTAFNRDALETSFLGNIPSPTPAVTRDAAGSALKGTLSLELIYVTDEEHEGRAVLRYVPRDQRTLYVDAQTGALVSADGDMAGYAGGNSASSSPAATEDAGEIEYVKRLTQAELSGAEKLEGVLPREELDQKVRAEAVYQLDKLTLSQASYRLVKEGRDEKEVVLCTLRYTSEDEDVYSRTVTVDARTGQVRSLHGYGRWDENRTPSVSADQARDIARSFLGRFTGHAGTLELYETEDRTGDGAPGYDFTFARKVNGYFFPQNVCSIQVDCETGAVCGVSLAYDEDVSFDAASGLVSPDAALDAWMDTYEVALAYRRHARDLDAGDPVEARLIEMGLTRFFDLFLSYGLERESYCPGVDAKTGKPVERSAENGDLSYGDLSGSWAANEIRKLADFGVGYAGGVFRPGKALTQWDAVCLLASTRGLRLDPDTATEEERNSAYETAYRMGALPRQARNDSAALTRGALVRLLLDSAGYGPVAALNGVFQVRYRDSDAIPAGEIGYAALARGLGLVGQADYAAGAAADRATAAAMLCRLMERDV